MSLETSHKIGTNYTALIRSRKTKRQLPLVARLKRRVDIEKLRQQMAGVLARHQDEINAFDFKLDPASTEHQYNLRNRKGELFVQNYESIYKKYSLIGFHDLTDAAKNLANSLTISVASLTPSQRLRGMLDTSSKYYHPFYDERNYTKLTRFCDGYVKEILSSFTNPCCRSALVNLNPGEFLSPHYDIGPEFITRLQLPVITNSGARVGVRNRDGAWEEYYLPADGCVYFINAGYEHYAINCGVKPRWQIRICLDGQDDLVGCEELIPVRTLTQDDFEKLPFSKERVTDSIDDEALKEFNL